METKRDIENRVRREINSANAESLRTEGFTYEQFEAEGYVTKGVWNVVITGALAAVPTIRIIKSGLRSPFLLYLTALIFLTIFYLCLRLLIKRAGVLKNVPYKYQWQKKAASDKVEAENSKLQTQISSLRYSRENRENPFKDAKRYYTVTLYGLELPTENFDGGLDYMLLAQETKNNQIEFLQHLKSMIEKEDTENIKKIEYLEVVNKKFESVENGDHATPDWYNI